MPDPADLAQPFESNFLACALKMAKAQPGPAPAIIDGVPCCAACGEEIPEKRLRALPGVGLCVGCAK